MSTKNTPRTIISTASKVSDHPKYVPERDRPMSIEGEFRVAVVGDIVQTRPVTELADPTDPRFVDLPPPPPLLLNVVGNKVSLSLFTTLPHLRLAAVAK